MLDKKSSTLKYYRETAMDMTSDTPVGTAKPKGTVRLEEVLDIAASIVPDAGEYSFDLCTADRVLTLRAESNETMVQWALAVSQATAAAKISQAAAAAKRLVGTNHHHQHHDHGR